MRAHRTAVNLIQLFILVAAAVVLMMACGGSPEMRVYRGLAITGETLDDAAKHVQSVNALFVTRCNAKTLTARQCNDWIDFGEKFKKVYPSSVALWRSSRTVADSVLRKQTDEIIATLLGELVKFGSVVGYEVLFKSEDQEATPWLRLSFHSSH
jgi:hypothetical protein